MKIPLPNKFTIFCDKNLWRLYRFLSRNRDKIFNKRRPSSYPYVTGDSFRALADHIHDETKDINPQEVMTGDIIFVNNDRTIEFLTKIDPLIKNKYILIEHNGDKSIDKSVTDLISEKVVKFFAQDVVHYHEKIVPIPIGIENRHFYVNGITKYFDWIIKKINKIPPRKKDRIIYNFSINTNPKERGPALELFKNHPLMDTIGTFISSTLHLKILLTYKFVASPPGNAIESCRTWEALYVKTIPIVKDFVAMKYFGEIGLPIWIVSDWNELNKYSESDLNKKYKEIMDGANFEPLHMDYWIKQIMKYKVDVKQGIL